MKKMLNEYDETKRMLKTLRELKPNSSSLKKINEQEEKSDVDVINDVDVRLISNDQVDLQLSDDQRTQIIGLIDTFREQVSETADLEPGITFNQNQIRLDGVITQFDLKFVLISGNQAGVFINAEMLEINDEVLAVINSLTEFYPQFNDAMDTMLRERTNN